jgi:hypothetical protein
MSGAWQPRAGHGRFALHFFARQLVEAAATIATAPSMAIYASDSHANSRARAAACCHPSLRPDTTDSGQPQPFPVIIGSFNGRSDSLPSARALAGSVALLGFGLDSVIEGQW